ncbi:MAG: hypothetical protein AB7T38_05855 [Nitrospirales bacterium]
MRRLTDHSYCVTVLFWFGMACRLGMAGCTWEEVKEKGYETIREHRTQQCLNDPSRRTSECVDQQPYDSYQRERSVFSGPPSQSQ